MIYKRFFISLCFLTLGFGNLFSQTKTIRNLQLDFKQTFETKGKKSYQINGNLYYQNNPYFFVYNITSPENQTNYVNGDGCFYKDKTGLYNFNEGLYTVNQTCIDYLTWFKKDYGLRDSNFIQNEYYIEENNLITQWKYDGSVSNGIQKIKTFCNNKNEVYRIQTFNANDTLISQIDLSDFFKKTGFSFPGKIVTQSFSNNQITDVVTLELKNVKFNQLDEKFADLKKSKILITKSIEKSEIKNESEISKMPAEKKFNVSITSALVSTAFSGYKAFITNQDNSACPYEPTCSQYMKDAVTKNGLFGIIQGLDRLKRCTAEEHSSNRYITNKNGKHVDPVYK